MKKVVLTLILCLSSMGVAFAQNNMEGMRILTVNAMMRYGQNLYDRGDFDGAATVFNRVLTFDHHQAQALQYIKEMGRVPAGPQNNFVETRADQEIIKPVDASDTDSLKAAIEAKKLSIDRLRDQIMQMKAMIESQLNEN